MLHSSIYTKRIFFLVEDFFFIKLFLNTFSYHSWYMKVYPFLQPAKKIDLAWVSCTLNTSRSSMCLFVLVCAVLIGGFFLFNMELLYMVNNAFYFSIIDIFFKCNFFIWSVWSLFLIYLYFYLTFFIYLFIYLFFCFTQSNF